MKDHNGFKKPLILLFLSVFSLSSLFGGLGTLSYYGDSRGFNSLSMLSGGKLPAGFGYFGFIDLHGDHDDPRARLDLTRYFLEYRLKRDINPEWVFNINGIGVELEYNDLTGQNNNAIRAGVTYRHNLPVLEGSWLQWRFHPYESDGSGMQASVIYNFTLTKRLSLNGFADLNFDENNSVLIFEPQLNFNLYQNLNIVIEIRYNGYEEKNPNVSGNGIAAGIMFKL